jgi:predicted ATPase/class 3 adenylate cyclase
VRTDLPTGTVTFLFTDIAGSTRLLHALGPEAYGDALAEHRRRLREAFAAHGGVEVDTQGDAFLVAFPTATGAAAAARAGHEALAGGPIRVRMGMHTGAPNVAGEGYVGIDVHRGARVGALAHGGQTVVSPTTAVLLAGEPLLDLGQHRLKDFDGATRLFQLGEHTFPPLRTPGSVDLPSPATRFLGRERELFEAIRLVLEDDPRVLTIVGPGGTGKTRFALELARLLADEAEGGTVFVALAPLRDPALILPTIADRLGASSGEPAAIATRVGDRRTHLLCDNLEQMLPAAAPPLAELAVTAPALRILTTSREPLRIQGEVELDLPPLAEAEAVTLFLERAHAVRPELAASDDVSELCSRLDRLPLALELAAARTKLLSPDVLLERLGQRLDLLKGTRDADERHATLRATIAWSYDLLDDEEQRLFRRLAVFRGGCTLESAEAVGAADLDVLGSLLDKSLLRRRAGRRGEERYWMLETIHEFAAEALEESRELADIRDRHAVRMLDIARAAHLSEDSDEPRDQLLALSELDDLRGALEWTADHQPVVGLELAVALENVWGAHAPTEGVRRLRVLLERTTDADPRLRARALRVLAGAAHQERAWDVADESYRESLRLFTEIGDARGIASVQTRLAYRAFSSDRDLSKGLIETSEALAKGNFPLIEAQNAKLLAHLALADGRLDESESLARHGLEMIRPLSWGWWEASVFHLLADIALERGDLAAAESWAREGLAVAAEEESALSALYATAQIARAARERGDVELAGELWGAVCSEGEQMAGWEERRPDVGASLLDETRPEFLGAYERGRRLELWDAVAIALGEDEVEGQTVP